MKGFISECGNYGVFPFGKQWMVVYHNQQLEVFRTQKMCKDFIKKHQSSLETVPKPPQKRKRSPTIKTK